MVRGLVYVTGRAVWPDPERFAFFQLLVGPGNDPAPTSLQPVSPRVDQPRTGGFLAVWDTGDLPAGDYTLVLVVDDVDGNELQARVSVVVEAAPARPTATSAPTVRPESGSPEAIPPESAPPVATLPLPLEPLPTRSPFAPVYEPAREPTATPYLPRPLPTPGGEPALAPIPTPLPVPPPLIPTQAPPVFPPTPPVPTPPGVP